MLHGLGFWVLSQTAQGIYIVTQNCIIKKIVISYSKYTTLSISIIWSYLTPYVDYKTFLEMSYSSKLYIYYPYLINK